MDRLGEVVIFTGDMGAMRRFWEQQVGLVAREVLTDWVAFDTSGGTLAVRLMHDSALRGVELRFLTADLDARARELSQRGVEFDGQGVQTFAWGRSIHFRDPEGNRLALLEPVEPYATGVGLPLSVAINCSDLDAQKRFYREVLGLTATIDSPEWVQLAAGGAGLGLHPRGRGDEGHHVVPITLGLSVPDLHAWHFERAALGLAFTSPPTDRGYGLYADAADPDGNPVTCRQAPEPDEVPDTLEEQLAEAFEDDAPTRTGMHKSVIKTARATSRVAVRPQYKETAAPRRRTAGKPKRVASPRGTGPAGSRQKPKKLRDPKRARTKPAIGRLRKAERKTFKAQKQTVAAASKAKPVKRASTARPRRAVKARRPATPRRASPRGRR